MNKAPARSLHEYSDSSRRQPRQTAACLFASHFSPGTLAIGFIGPLLGLALWQSLLAIVPAVLLGSWLALNCRVSLLAWPVALLVHVLNLDILFRLATHVLPGTALNWQLLALTLAGLIAFIGPPLLYRLLAMLAPLLAVVFGLITLGAVLILEPDSAPRAQLFSWSSFGCLSLMAALWQLSVAPLATRSTPSYAGIALPALWLMPLGALMASAIPAVDTVVSLRLVANHFYPGLGTLGVLLLGVAMVGAMAAHSHGLIQRSTEKARVLMLAGFSVLALWLAGQFSVIDLLH